MCCLRITQSTTVSVFNQESLMSYIFVSGNGMAERVAYLDELSERMRAALPGLFDSKNNEEMLHSLFRGESYTYNFYQDGMALQVAAAHLDTQDDIETYYNTHLDNRKASRDYIQSARAGWQARDGAPRVGDICRKLNGKTSRFTYDWGDGLQDGGGSGSYHVSKSGLVSYSGGLSDTVMLGDIQETNEMSWENFWFFLDGFAGANRAIGIVLPVRIWLDTNQKFKV